MTRAWIQAIRAAALLLSINIDHPEPRKIRRAVDALEAGGVIAYPTDTVYGLGCDLTNKNAIERLYAIKGMERSHPLAFVCPDLSDIARYAIVENQVYRVLRRFLPGPYTFILGATREVPKLVQMKRKNVGIRVPACEATRALARELGRPIISSTAARPGEQPLVDPKEIDAAFKGLALVLDGGAGGLVPTSVIDLTTSPPEIVREGAGDIEDFR
ncbi:MAG TPA: L-threonylcarbamoyladenylate synthase [Polyangiaceae bacterium]|nr:L-threonylcarbamoyladenylate synthase [Polyangiaceae bacterium]